MAALAASLLVLLAALPAHAQQWLPPIQKVPHLFVQTEILGIRDGVTRSLGKGNIEAYPGRPGTLTLPLDLGPSAADHPTSIEIEVTQNGTGEPKIGLTVATTITVTSRTGAVSRIRRERVAEVDEGRSFFHQAYDNAAQGTSVLLTLTPDTRIVPQLVKPSMSAPILFNVSLSRVTRDGEVPLEDNVLRTLENSPVSYAFRIARAAAAPVEATTAVDASPDGAQVAGSGTAASTAPDGAAPAVAPPSAPSAAHEAKDANGANDAKGTKTKKTKPKKMSKKERERDTLAQFKAARDAQAAQADGTQPVEGSPPAPASADAGSTASGAPTGTATPPAGEGAAAAAAPTDTAGATAEAPGAAPPADTAGAPPTADELELTLLPHRVESGILMVEASLRGRAPGSGGAGRATLVQRTQAITSNGSFDITVTGLGPAGAGSYRFSVQARF